MRYLPARGSLGVFVVLPFLFFGEILYNVQLTPQKLSAGQKKRTGAQGASAFVFL